MVVAVLFLFFQRVSGGSTTVFGYSVFRVSSGSMEPELSVGDVILSKKINANTLEIGDIITYNGTEGDYANKIITHKIVNIDNSGVEKVFTTQGVANNTADPPVYESQVLGKMVYKVPVIGTLYNFFMTIYGLIAVILIILLAFSNEIITLFKLAKEKVHRDVTREFEEQNGTSFLNHENEQEEENKIE
jgi:signal peptidase